MRVLELLAVLPPDQSRTITEIADAVYHGHGLDESHEMYTSARRALRSLERRGMVTPFIWRAMPIPDGGWREVSSLDRVVGRIGRPLRSYRISEAGCARLRTASP
jgi:hypothetical protein